MKEPKDTFGYVFAQGQDFFANYDIGSMLTVIEGEPGVGKTMLGLEIARQFSYLSSREPRGFGAPPHLPNVFFVAIEQDIRSLVQMLADFVSHFAEFARDRCFFRERKGKWVFGKIPEIRKGITVFFKAAEKFEKPDGLVSWIAHEVPEIKEEVPCDCGLIIVDNANVFVPKTYHRPDGGSEGFYLLSRHVLHQIKDEVKNTKAHLVLIVEGHPERTNPDIEFYADAVVRLSAARTEHGRRTQLEVVKSRHRSTSPGIHTLEITKEGFHLWPSPESILTCCNSEVRHGSARLYLPRFEGWEEQFGDLTILKKRDIILIEGDRYSGKSIIRRKIIRSTDGGLLLNWRETPSRSLRLEEIEIHWSDFIDPVAVAAQLLDGKDELTSGLVHAFKLDRADIREKYNLCKRGCELDDLAQELASQFNNKILLAARGLHKRRIAKTHISCEIEQLITEVDRDKNKIFVLNRLLLERIFAGRIKRLSKALSLPSDPSWDRNRIFYMIFKLIKEGFSECESTGRTSDRVVGLDDLVHLRDAFPVLRNDPEFIAQLFALSRKLGWTVVVTSRTPREEENLADVIIRLRHVRAEHSTVGMLQIHTKENRGLHPGGRIGYDATEGIVRPELLHVFRIAPDGEASRVNVNITLPYFSPAEIKHARDVCHNVVSIVGSEHVKLMGITSSTLEPDIVAPGEDKDTQGKIGLHSHLSSDWPVVSKIIRGGEQLEELQRLSAYPHHDLNILVIDDHVMSRAGWRENVENLLEPLGSVDEWKNRLGIMNDEDFFLEFIENSDGEVIGIPYQMDIGTFVYRQAPGKTGISGFRRETRELKLRNIGQFANIIQRNYITEQAGVKQPYFSFTSFGPETWVCFFWEFMEAIREEEGCYYPEHGSFLEKSVDALHSLRELVTKGQEFSGSPVMNPNAVCWRSWYSRLSCIKGCHNYFGLRRENIEVCPISDKRNVVAYRCFVIPRRSPSVELGKRLIQEFSSERRALERLEQFVGLSPYKRHYGEKDQESVAVMPDQMAALFRDAARNDFGSNTDDKFITRNQLWKDYGRISDQVGRRLKQAFFSDSNAEMDSRIESVMRLVKPL